MSVEQVSFSHASGRRQPSMKLSGRKYFISLNVQYKSIQNPELQWSGTKSTLVLSGAGQLLLKLTFSYLCTNTKRNKPIQRTHLLQHPRSEQTSKPLTVNPPCLLHVCSEIPHLRSPGQLSTQLHDVICLRVSQSLLAVFVR